MPSPNRWVSQTFTPGYIRDVNALIQKLRAKTDALSCFLNEGLDSATKECLEVDPTVSGYGNRLRVILSEQLNKVIAGNCLYDPTRFQEVKLRPETEKVLSQNPQGKDLIRLNRSLLEDAYQNELWRGHNWQPNSELCHPSHGLQIDRFEIIHESKFAEIAAEISDQISFVSPSTVVRPNTVELKDPWDFEEVYLALDGWADRYPFDVDKERYLIFMIKGTFVQQMCLFLLVESKQIPAILVHHRPPDEDLPHGKARLVDLQLSKYDRIAARFELRQKDAVSVLKRGIQTRNARFNQLMDLIERVAANNTKPILILGPTGAGKSELAKRIFDLRKQRGLLTGEAPVTVDCTTIRGDGAMSALFGHRKGAFTGATAERKGSVLTADKGLLFLDEIGDLGIEEQGLLLRALETKHCRCGMTVAGSQFMSMAKLWVRRR
jgi:sigma54-dependent transcription regulator